MGKLGERSVSMAALQSFFINMRKKSPDDAIAGVELIIGEMDGRDVAKAQAAEQKGVKDEKGKKDGKGKEKETEKRTARMARASAASPPEASLPAKRTSMSTCTRVSEYCALTCAPGRGGVHEWCGVRRRVG